MADGQRRKPPLRLGDYVLRDFVGRGAFAEVWTATRRDETAPVLALKIATDPAFAKQLAREAAFPSLAHPHIVPILENRTRLERWPFVVMPFLPGGNLARLIAQHRHGLPEMRVEALLKGMLRGLEAAHRRGIVHRDIKPQNVLLDAEGRALLADFGLSVGGEPEDVLRSVLQSASLAEAEARAVAGTLAYMAPEVREGRPAALLSDIYSVGVVLFEMLVGRRPEGLEMPSRARPDLLHGAYWDGLYRGACEGLEERFDSAGMMLRAVRSYGFTSRRRTRAKARIEFRSPLWRDPLLP